MRAPKWYQRKAGVSFGFGGKLVSFNSAESPAGSSEVHEIVRHCCSHWSIVHFVTISPISRFMCTI